MVKRKTNLLDLSWGSLAVLFVLTATGGVIVGSILLELVRRSALP